MFRRRLLWRHHRSPSRIIVPSPITSIADQIHHRSHPSQITPWIITDHPSWIKHPSQNNYPGSSILDCHAGSYYLVLAPNNSYLLLNKVRTKFDAFGIMIGQMAKMRALCVSGVFEYLQWSNFSVLTTSL